MRLVRGDSLEGLGFDYGFAKHSGVGVEMFGEIEDLANAGPFNSQVHSIGPTLFYKLGGDNDEAKADSENDAEKESGPADVAYSECRRTVRVDKRNL